jgi:hypothetical protein
MIMLDGILGLRGELTLIGVFNIQQVISYRGLKTDENI